VGRVLLPADHDAMPVQAANQFGHQVEMGDRFARVGPAGVGMVASSSRVRRTPPAWTMSWRTLLNLLGC
jgi:hypothetical protein